MIQSIVARNQPYLFDLCVQPYSLGEGICLTTQKENPQHSVAVCVCVCGCMCLCVAVLAVVGCVSVSSCACVYVSVCICVCLCVYVTLCGCVVVELCDQDPIVAVVANVSVETSI